MKIKSSIFLLLAALSVSLNSCYDSKMEWGDPYTHPETKDLPLGLQEAISRYEVLKNYAPANFKMGAGIGFDMYQKNATFRNVVDSNFNDVTPGNELKQQSLMKEDGTLNFDNADKVIAQIQAAGLSVYGHNLVWHSQQQATYLNSLIKGSAVSANMVAKSDFEGLPANASSDDLYGYGWNSWGGTSSREGSADGDGYGGGKCLIVHSSGATADYGVQATTTLTEAFVVGHTYHVEAMMKSSVSNGEARIQFQGGSAQYLPKDIVGTDWVKVQHNFVASSTNNKLFFDLGAVPADYYIDNVIVFDLGQVDMVTNGDFEGLPANASSDDVYGYGWNSWGGTSSREGSADGDGYGGAGKCLIVHSSGATADYGVQATTTLTDAFIVGHTYHVEAMMKSSVSDGEARIQFQGGSAQYLPKDIIGTDWVLVQHDFVASSANNKLFFDLGAVPADYYIDNVIVYDFTAITTGAGGDIIPMPDDQKKTVLTDVLTKYITDVVTHYKGIIGAWDVVNEPLNDNGEVRAGSEDLTQTSTFYWSYYLGKDYAVTAFKTAQAADPNAKLFINEYGLESSNGARLKGIIDYVQYIESQGAKVDGIGTQMHINLSVDTLAVDKMFQSLATTGKLIKITEMDVSVGTASPTDAQKATQANLYRYVVNSYMKNVPAAQQNGITVWGVSDNPDEHTNWLPNDAPCLFDANYVRKVAYKGFADGLAGKDVSADFSGELQY